MHFPFWFTLLIVVIRLVLIFCLLILLPGVLIRLFNKKFTIWMAFVIACLCFVLPIMSYACTADNVQRFFNAFQVWEIDGSTYRVLSWAFTAAADVASIYAGILLWKVRPLRQSTVQCFVWLALILHLCSMLLVPLVLFGDYVYSAAYDNEGNIIIYIVLVALSSLYLRYSKACKAIYADVKIGNGAVHQ